MRWAWAMGTVATVLGLGCEPEQRPAEFPPQLPDASGDASAADVPGDTTPTGLSGTWALATDWSTCVNVVDNLVELRTYKLLRVQMVQKGHKITEVRTLCSAVSTPLLGQTTTFPTPLLQAVGPLEVQGDLHGTGVGAGYASGPEVQLYGVKMESPLADPLPATSSDPRIIDTDADDQPGGTLQVGKICQLYVALRATSSLQGTQVLPGRIEGTAVQDNEQLTLGGSSPFCTQSLPSAPNQGHNAFVLQRLGPGGLALDTDGDGDVSCAEIVAGQAQIVKWRTEDDARCGP